MADKKISELTALTGALTAADDALVIVDTSTTTTKKIDVSELQAAPLSSGTANGITYLNASKVLTSGSALTFNGTTLALVASSASQSGTIYSRNTNSGASAWSGLTIGNDASNNRGGVLLASSAASASGFIGPNSTYLYNSSGLIAINAETDNPILFGVNSTEQMRLTSTGLGIGTSSPAYKLDVNGQARFASGAVLSGGSRLTMYTVSGENYGYIKNVGATTYNSLEIGANGKVIVVDDSYSAYFYNSAGGENMRIDSSGNVVLQNNLDFIGGAATVRIHLGGGTPSNSNSGIAAAWNLHSDYRLKENIAPISGALQRVLAINPVMFTWKGEQNGRQTAGFIAHELSEHAPYAVLGEKDAVNDDGAIIAQSADYSKIVPLLTAAIQELKAEFDAYKSSHP